MIRLTITLLAAFVLATGVGRSAKAQVQETDSLALLALYQATSGQSWTQKTNWLRGPVATWYGVTVSDGRVTRLELAANNLKASRFDFQTGDGVIPPEIGNLSALQVLDLHANELVGAAPSALTNLSALLHLRLHDNDLKDLPDLSVLGALTTLSVENNRLTFEDLEPNFGLAFTFTYAPQHPLPRPQGMPRTIYEGDTIDLHVPVGGANNRYQWFKDEVALPGATRNTHTLVNLTKADAGDYVLHITNTLVSDLTLTSRLGLAFDIRFDAQWLDIGAYHHAYVESGARNEVADTPAGMEYPAILRHSGHIYAKGFWIGVKDWTDPEGQHYPYYVARIGPRGRTLLGQGITFPIQNKLIGRYEDTLVEVNGVPSYDNEATLDAIDPGLPADRMLHNIHNMVVGITTERKVYAYTNPYHDNYHLIDYTYCNTGNTDDDDEIELPNQTLHDVYFFRIHRWRGNEQAAWTLSSAQVWGRYTVHDVVGDGHEAYPVDFTAQYAWYGYDVVASHEAGYSNLGSSLFTDQATGPDDIMPRLVAEDDSIGRLAGPTMVGRSTIHADRSATDPSYDREQPRVLSWIDNDEPLNGNDASHEDYYELGILTRENPTRNPGCTSCFTRAYPHFADRRQPNGEFWNPDGPDLLAGGFSPTTGYGPYEMAPGECVNIVVSEGIAGLSFDAATKIGRAYKRSGAGRDSKLIPYDANGDGVIDTTPFDYDNVFVGTEAQTKNQWVMTARDSLFQMFFRARDLFAASHALTTYPIAEPPRAPSRFSLWGRAAGIELDWEPAPNGPAVVRWELYRTEHREDNLYVNGCLDDPSIGCGYALVALLPASTTAYTDTDVRPDTDYYYYIEGIGEPQPVDPLAIGGTPQGFPLRSSRYLTQTYTPVALPTNTAGDPEAVPEPFALEQNYPNPFNPTTRIRYALAHSTSVRLTVYDAQGRRLAVLIDATQPAGRHEVTFEAGGLASGLYFYRLEAGAFRATRAMLLFR